MPKKNIRQIFSLPDRQVALLRSEARTMQISLSDLMRRIIDQHIENKYEQNRRVLK